jgi:hypothetical protein
MEPLECDVGTHRERALRQIMDTEHRAAKHDHADRAMSPLKSLTRELAGCRPGP